MSDDVVSQNLRFLSCSLSHNINGSNAVFGTVSHSWLKTRLPLGNIWYSPVCCKEYNIEKNHSRLWYVLLLSAVTQKPAICCLWIEIEGQHQHSARAEYRIQEQQWDKKQKSQAEGHELSWFHCRGEHQEMQSAGRIPEREMCYVMCCCAVCCGKLWRQLCFVLRLLLRGIT